MPDIFVELMKTGEVYKARIMANGDAMVLVNNRWRRVAAANFERRYRQVEQVKTPPAPPKPLPQKAVIQRAVSQAIAAVAKPKMLRLPESYFAAVRRLPCQFEGCGRPGPSEASHRNLGKGLAIKAHDLLAALCHEHHVMIDQRRGLSARDADYEWLKACYNTNVLLMKEQIFQPPRGTTTGEKDE